MPPVKAGGTQAAYLQMGDASIAQTFPVPAGTYVISFKAVGRKETLTNGVQLWFNNALVQTWTDTQFSQDSWQTYTSGTITVAATGSYNVKFVGVGGTGDRATAIDDVSMRKTGGAINYVAGSASTATGATMPYQPLTS